MKYFELYTLIYESKLDDAVLKHNLLDPHRKFLEAIDPGAQLFQNKYVTGEKINLYMHGGIRVGSYKQRDIVAPHPIKSAKDYIDNVQKALDWYQKHLERMHKRR